jgi:AraC-like DNA-binding protein
MPPSRPGTSDEKREQPARAVRWRAGTTSIRSVPAWEEAIARNLAAPNIAAITGEPFHGRLRARALDVLRLLHLDVPPHTLQGGGSEENPSYQFVLPVEGSVRVSQETRHVDVVPGRFAVADTTSAYEIAFDDPAVLMVIQVPHQVIGIPPLLLRPITATGVGVDGDLIAVALPLLVRLADDLIVSSRHSPVRFAYNLADLLTTVLLEHLSAVVPGGSANGLMLEITTYLDDHLGDAELSAETVAAAHYISPRYLRKLFENQHIKVSEWIRTRRLETCRRQLVDPVLADEPISIIAARWGFPDPAHFSRLFKATYGRSPRQFRRDGLGHEHHDEADEEPVW